MKPGQSGVSGKGDVGRGSRGGVLSILDGGDGQVGCIVVQEQVQWGTGAVEQGRAVRSMASREVRTYRKDRWEEKEWGTGESPGRGSLISRLRRGRGMGREGLFGGVVGCK